jgi:hypothetical protein
MKLSMRLPTRVSAIYSTNITCTISPIYIRKLDSGLEPRNKKWLSMTDPLQTPLSGQTFWTKMQEIYHNP